MSEPRPTILVCDDDPAIRSIVATKLRGAGMEVFEARNGLEGLCYVDHGALPPGQAPRHAVPIVPRVVVTDLQMPQMSGLELAQKLRDCVPTRDVPVLMLTARGYILDRTQMDKTNIRQLMAKPFGASQLLEQVRVLMESPLRAAA